MFKNTLNFIQKAFHKTLGKCPNCNKYFTYPRKRRMNTAYAQYESNFEVCCLNCHNSHEEFWEEMWKEYYAGKL